MSRNSSGTYTLPSGNPVVSGTLIEASWANTTLSDLASAMTDSLSRSGQGGMTAALRLYDGTSTVPGLAWASETTTGWYRAGAGDMRLVITGSEVMKYLSTGVAITGTLSASGNATLSGTLSVTGASTFTGAITANGGVSGSVTSSSATITGGSINGTTVGATTASTGAFTTLSASSTVSGTGFSTYLASPPAIGGTAANSGAFTTLSASSTVSGTGFSTYLASPPAIGGTTPAAGSFTTLTASGALTAASLSGPHNGTVGATTPSTGAFTTLSASSTVTLSGGTATGVGYLSAGKVLTTSANLTFDGTALTLGGNGSFTSGYSGNGLVLSKTNVGSKNAIVSAANTSSVLLINNSADGWDSVAIYAAGSEGMRLTSAGLLVGKTSSSGFVVGCEALPDGQLIACRDGNFAAYFNRLSSDGTLVSFNRSNTQVGSVSVTTTATSYNTASDYRLKNVVGPITGSGAYIDGLNPVEGTWKNGAPFVGLLAHEVQAISRTPVATGVKDGEEMQAMDYSSAEIIANMLAELKSVRRRLAQLEASALQ